MNEKTSDVPEYATTRTLPSGFTIATTPLPPYYADIIEDIYPFRDPPVREITLHAGDVYEEPYEPPDEMPDPEDEEYYALWLRWHEVERYNEEIKKKKMKAKRDLLLSLCVHIIDGPVDIDSEDWIQRIEAPFVEDDQQKDIVLQHKGQKHLLFLKYVVITDMESHKLIMDDATFKEVSLQGIGYALHGFRDNVG